jgi:hypothetical protein
MNRLSQSDTGTPGTAGTANIHAALRCPRSSTLNGDVGTTYAFAIAPFCPRVPVRTTHGGDTAQARRYWLSPPSPLSPRGFI